MSNRVLSLPIMIIILSMGFSGVSTSSDPPEGDLEEKTDFNDFSMLKMYGFGEQSSLEYSPDGKELAVATEAGVIIFYDTSDYSILRKYYFRKDSINAINWSYDGDKIAVGLEKEVIILDPVNGDRILTFITNKTVEDIKWSPDSRFISANLQGEIAIHDATNGVLIYNLNRVNDVGWSPDSSMIAIPSEWNIEILNSSNGRLIKKYVRDLTPAENISFYSFEQVQWIHDGSRIIYSSYWHIRGKPIYKQKILVFNADNGNIICNSGDLAYHLQKYAFTNLQWDKSCVLPNNLWYEYLPEGFENCARVKVATTNDPKLVSITMVQNVIHFARYDSVFLIQCESDNPTKEIKLNPINNTLGNVIKSPDEKHIAYNAYHELVIIDSHTGELLQNLKENDDVANLAWSSDGSAIAYSINNYTKILDVGTNSIVKVIKHPAGTWVNAQAWRTDSHVLAIRQYSLNSTNIWNTISGELIAMLNTEHPVSLAWSPSGNMLAIGSWNGTITLWDTTTWLIQRTIVIPEDNDYTYGDTPVIFGLDWSNDGNYIAGSFDTHVGIWSAKSGSIIHDFNQYENSDIDQRYCCSSSNSLSFSPDDSKLAIQSNELIIWEFENDIASIFPYPSNIGNNLVRVNWISNGNQVLCGYRDGTIKIWGSPADLRINASDIQFSNDLPRKGDKIQVSVTITNEGKLNATNFEVRIYNNGEIITQQNVDLLLKNGGSRTINANFNMAAEDHVISVEIDNADLIPEFNETNNMANRTLEIKFTSSDSSDSSTMTISTVFAIAIAIIFIVVLLLIMKRRRN